MSQGRTKDATVLPEGPQGIQEGQRPGGPVGRGAPSISVQENDDKVGTARQGAGGRAEFGPPRNVGERSEPECSGGPNSGAREVDPPDPEVPAKATRRRFSAKYKLRILKEIDACAGKHQVGAIYRREGLFSSNVAAWREQSNNGVLAALKPKKRGRKAKPVDPLQNRIAELQSENERLRKRLQQAETIIDFQKKLSEMLGLSTPLENGTSS